ncbi:MAG: hypothetical protein QOE23_62, partial [Pseudonocardiales bacterium]|nr:hypothetical protein [Pseudonocardiales bacterium]
MTAASFQHHPEAEFSADQDADYHPDSHPAYDDPVYDIAYDITYDNGHDLAADQFDDSDGAYAVAEPDPFDQPPAVALRRPALRPALRAELNAQRAGAITTLTTPALPPLPVPIGLGQLLPDGLRRGSTVAITSSVSLLLALLGPASAAGAWTAMVGMPAISAEAAVEAGIALERLAIISPPSNGPAEPGTDRAREDRSDAGARTGPSWNPAREDRSDAGARTGPSSQLDRYWSGPSWATAVGAVLVAVDVVVAGPGGVSNGDARRLTARA